MCGINGIVASGLHGDKIVAMNTALAHRGPDADGVYTYEGIALGHKRLAIIDLSPAGKQPMEDASGRYVVVFNGEIYNYRELREKITAYKFSTNTDTEVILAAYIQWGVNCLQQFNGMFAFAIWDKQSKSLFIARDRLGIKPLYYTTKNNELVFSSEMRALLAAGIAERVLDRDALIDYLRYQTVHAPATILKGVQMLLPGHYILHNAKEGLKIESYWDKLQHIPVSQSLPYAEACIKVNELFTAAVKRRLVADVPFGAFLSGGIDSSAVVGTMSKVHTGRVKTFCVVFDEKEFSEAPYAKMVAQKFNTEHTGIKLSPKDFLNILPEALNAVDHPSGDGSNTYLVSKVTRQAGVTMALSGLGGDELFAGYPIFKRALALERRKWIYAQPRFLRGLEGGLLKTLKPGVASEKIAAILLAGSGFSSFYPINRQVLSDAKIKKLLKKQGLSANAVNSIVDEIKASTNQKISRVSAAEMSSYMQNVLLRDTDQMSMASALEVRVPFLDHELVEFVLSLDDTLKYPYTPKKLLVDAMGDLLPKEIVNRPKMGFRFPWEHWLKNELKEFAAVSIESLSDRKEFNKAEVLALWDDFLKGNKSITWSRVWILVVLGHWLKHNNIG